MLCWCLWRFELASGDNPGDKVVKSGIPDFQLHLRHGHSLLAKSKKRARGHQMLPKAEAGLQCSAGCLRKSIGPHSDLQFQTGSRRAAGRQLGVWGCQAAQGDKNAIGLGLFGNLQKLT